MIFTFLSLSEVDSSTRFLLSFVLLLFFSFLFLFFCFAFFPFMLVEGLLLLSMGCDS